MTKEHLLRLLVTIQGVPYAMVRDGEAQFIGTTKVIPVENIMYQKVPADGFYELDAHICPESDNPCSVGNRHSKDVCSMSSKRKCGVWSFSKVNNIELHIDDLLKLINDAAK